MGLIVGTVARNCPSWTQTNRKWIMHQSINIYQFRDAFVRADRAENFSYDGLGWLWQYFEDYEAGTGESVELDVIAICCEFSECTFEEAAEKHSIDISGCTDDAEIRDTVLEYLEWETVICGYGNGRIVYADF